MSGNPFPFHVVPSAQINLVYYQLLPRDAARRYKTQQHTTQQWDRPRPATSRHIVPPEDSVILTKLQNRSFVCRTQIGTMELLRGSWV